MLRQIDRHALVAGYIYLVVFFVGNGVSMSSVNLYLGRRRSTGISMGGVVVVVSSLAGVILVLRASLGILGGPLADTQSYRLCNSWPVVRLATLVGVVGFAALALARGLWAVPAGVALVSLSTGALTAVLAAVLGDQAAGWRSPTSMCKVATAGDIASASPIILTNTRFRRRAVKLPGQPFS